MSAARRRWIAIGVALAMTSTGGWMALLRLDPPPEPRVSRPPSLQVQAGDGRLLRAFLADGDAWRPWVNLEDISPHVTMSFLQKEDRFFFRHPGVNPVAAVRAAATNLAHGRIVSGASTITMQLARLTDRRLHAGGGAWVAKLGQIYRALQYECLLTKSNILECYLNLVPCGGNIEGVAAASRIYFGKSPGELSMAEAALLAVIPQSPARRHPIRHRDRARVARDRLLADLEASGHLDDGDAARREPLPTTTFRMPMRAPHFTDWVRRNDTGIDANGILATTLDLDLQERAHTLLRQHARGLASRGVRQAALVIIDYRANELVTMIGSTDFHGAEAGQVNGTVAIRSPGSTLKPFLYGLAFQAGLLAPESFVADVPREFIDGYAPENFDRTFLGPTTARIALQTSRNLPAVTIAERLATGGASLFDFLMRAGVTSLRHDADYYGLALVLGGGDVTLLELAQLYATLARHGQHEPLTWRRQPATMQRPARTVLDARAAYLVLDCLTDVERPYFATTWRSGQQVVPVAWKTGTSIGHRDAWSLGIAGNYVVGVWIGNFDGSGVPELTGKGMAAPLLFDVIRTLPGSVDPAWQRRPPGIETQTTCTVSGARPNRWCPAQKPSLVVPGVSPSSSCAIHRELWIDPASAVAVCARCVGARHFERRVIAWWPERVARFERAAGADWTPLPVHDPACTSVRPDAHLDIISPARAGSYELSNDRPLDEQQVALIADAGTGVSELHWFVNGRLVHQCPPGEKRFWRPATGRHTITVRDDAGRSATHRITVSLR